MSYSDVPSERVRLLKDIADLRAESGQKQYKPSARDLLLQDIANLRREAQQNPDEVD